MQDQVNLNTLFLTSYWVFNKAKKYIEIPSGLITKLFLIMKI